MQERLEQYCHVLFHYSFLLGKLREEMKVFTRDWVIEPTLKHSVLLLIVVLHLAVVAGVLAWVLAYTMTSTDVTGTGFIFVHAIFCPKKKMLNIFSSSLPRFVKMPSDVTDISED